MSVKLFDRVKQFTLTEGTGTLTLSTVPNGFQSFSSVLSNNDKTYYVIENKGAWEVGLGVYNSGTLSRSAVLDSSTGTRISLSGKSNVFITLPADKMVFLNDSGISNIEIDQLYDLRILTPQSGQILTYNGTYWINQQPAPTYNDENAQDAVGGIFTNSSTINFSYNDNTPSISAVIPTGAITNNLIATGIDVSKLSGIINSSNLPSYVDDVLEYANFASLPPTGESGKIYLTIDTNRSYRWSGSQYVQITDTTALWGSITGTLSDQTDIINYVVPQTRSVIAGTGLTGGGQLSSNVTLNLGNTAVTPGSYGSSSGVSSFTVDAQGRLTQASEVSINGLLPTGGTEGQILAKNSATNYDTGWIDNYAKELVQTIKNSTHTTLTKGQVVYISGADGTNPIISLAVASGEATSSKTLGFLKQDLNHGDIGYVITEGFLDGLNTNSATAEGDPIWLSPTVPGGVVYGLANKPYAPNHMVFLGFVVRKNINNGRIYVKVQNGFELKELHDVLAQSPSDGDIIRYVSSSGLWVSQPMPISYTDENAQDAVGNILTNTSSVNFSYNDNLNTISAVVVDSGVNHNLLSNYVANEHVNHTGVLINAGTGLTGGGDISSSRTISIADTTVSSGNYGSSNQVGTFTVNPQGQLTAATNVSITPSSIGALGSLNGLTGSTQTFGTGTAGTDFGIVSSGSSHTFNLPNASATVRGVVTTGSQTFAGAKTFSTKVTVPATGNANGGIGNGANGIDFAGGIYTYVSGSAYPTYTGTSGGVPFFKLAQNAVLEWSGNDNDAYTVANTAIGRWENGHVSVRFGLTSCKLSVTNSFTNAANYERAILQFVTYASGRYAQLACESAGTGIANMNLVLTPKGTGALISGPMPDGTATGGNARGQYAIDLQTFRTAATQVTADYGVSIGTQITNIGGNGSVAIGRNCSVSNGQLGGEVAIGRNCTVTSYRGVAIGASASAGSDGVAIGVASYAADQGAICFNGAASSWTGVNIWRNNYTGNPTGTAYNQRTLTGVFAVGLAHIRTSTITQTTIDTIGYTTFISNRFRHKGAIFHTSLSVFAVRSDGAIAKFQRNVTVKDISNAAGTSSTLSIIQVETVGTDYSEISGAAISFAVDSTAKSVSVRCVGEAEYAATGVASTDIITAVGHPFANDDIVIFNTLTGGSGLTANPTGQYYFGIYKVINVSGNTFQLAAPGSSTTPIDFTTDITVATIARPICWSTSGPMTTVLAGGY